MRAGYIPQTPEDDLRTYVQEIAQYDTFHGRKDEEYDLINAWHERGDMLARDAVIKAHLLMAFKIAARYRYSNVPFNELVSESNLGLFSAMNEFPDIKERAKGNLRFFDVAKYKCRERVRRYILANKHSVTLPSRYTTFYFGARAKFAGVQDLRDEAIADWGESVKLTRAEAIDAYHAYIAPPQAATAKEEPYDMGKTEALIEQDEFNKRMEKLHTAMETLTRKEFLVFKYRRLVDPPLHVTSIARVFGCTPTSISQTQKRAEKKITASMLGLNEGFKLVMEEKYAPRRNAHSKGGYHATGEDRRGGTVTNAEKNAAHYSARGSRPAANI